MKAAWQCCGSGFIESGSECGSGCSISREFGTGSSSRSRVLMTKNWGRKIQLEKIFIFEIFFSLGLLKGHSSYRRSLQPSKENIQHFKKWTLWLCSIFVGHFFPPGFGSGLRIRIQIQRPHWILIRIRNTAAWNPMTDAKLIFASRARKYIFLSKFCS